MKMRKGLLLLIAATLAGSNCFADPLYDTGLIVMPVGNIQTSIHSYEISELRKAFTLNPKDFNLSLRIAELLYQDGDQDNSMLQIGSNLMEAKDDPAKLDEIKGIILKRIDENPKFDFNYIVLGKFYKVQKNDEETINQCKKALEITPGNKLAQIELAKAYQRIGEYKNALEIYNSILKKSPYTKGVRAFRGDCYYELGEKDKAEADYRTGLRMEPEIFNFAAGLYMCLKDDKNLKEIYKEIYPEYNIKPITAENYIDFVTSFKVIILPKYKDQKEIRRLYNEALRLDPLNTTAYEELTYLYKEQNDYKNLKNLLYKCMTPIRDKKTGELINTDDSSTKIAAALAAISPNLLLDTKELLSKNHDKEAAEILFRITESNLEVCLLKAELFSDIDSIFWYKKALELSPNNKEIFYLIAKRYNNINDYDNAKECIKQALIISPKDKNCLSLQKDIMIAEDKFLVDIAWKYMDEGNYDSLKECLNKIFANNCVNPEAYILRGALQLRNEDKEAALQDYIKACELEPKNVLANRMAGQILEAQDQSKAIKHYRQCILFATEPDNVDVKYAASRLLELNQVVPVNFITK